MEEAQSRAVAMPPKIKFEPLKAQEMSDGRVKFRVVPVPSHRRKSLEKDWKLIYNLVYHELKVDIRMNLKARRVELKTRPETSEICYLQKCADFVHAFVLGFEVRDAKNLLQRDDVYIDSFEIKDVKMLRGEHKSRAIGRLSGRHGRTKFAIENATETKIAIADTKIHILGEFSRIKIGRDCLCKLILGSPAAKVYSRLRILSSRLNSSY